MVKITAVILLLAFSLMSVCQAQIILERLIASFGDNKNAPRITINGFGDLFRTEFDDYEYNWRTTRPPRRQYSGKPYSYNNFRSRKPTRKPMTFISEDVEVFSTRPSPRRPVTFIPEDVEVFSSRPTPRRPINHRPYGYHDGEQNYANARSVLAVPLRQCNPGERLQKGKCKKIHRTTRS